MEAGYPTQRSRGLNEENDRPTRPRQAKIPFKAHVHFAARGAAATAAVLFLHLHVETIGARFGGIPSGLPKFAVPHFHYDIFRQLLSSAFTVAMLGAIESLMSAVVSDRMSNDKHNPNMELIGQGVANIVSPLFGGLPATGAIARTATNVRAGAKTPVAGIIRALTLLAIVLFAAPLVKSVPLAALAAILMIVAYNMGDWEEIPEILKLSKADIAVWLLTLTLTVVTDLTFAVEVGMVLAALTFIRKVSRTTTVSPVTRDYVEDSRVHVLQGKDIPDYAIVYRIHGPFLFGATDKFSDILHSIDTLPPIVILRLRNMTAIDATGRHPRPGGLSASFGTLPAFVRCPRATLAIDEAVRFRKACRRGEYLREYYGSPATRRGGLSDAPSRSERGTADAKQVNGQEIPGSPDSVMPVLSL